MAGTRTASCPAAVCHEALLRPAPAATGSDSTSTAPASPAPSAGACAAVGSVSWWKRPLPGEDSVDLGWGGVGWGGVGWGGVGNRTAGTVG
jgi:hypothetical protein